MDIYRAELKRREDAEFQRVLQTASPEMLDLASTLEKTVANIKADPTNPINIELARILSELKDGLDSLKNRT